MALARAIMPADTNHHPALSVDVASKLSFAYLKYQTWHHHQSIHSILQDCCSQDLNSSSPPYPGDNSKHQQLNERSDRVENGTKMIASTFIALEMALIPSMLP
jgi:hypothetical protein